MHYCMSEMAVQDIAETHLFLWVANTSFAATCAMANRHGKCSRLKLGLGAADAPRRLRSLMRTRDQALMTVWQWGAQAGCVATAW